MHFHNKSYCVLLTMYSYLSCLASVCVCVSFTIILKLFHHHPIWMHFRLAVQCRAPRCTVELLALQLQSYSMYEQHKIQSIWYKSHAIQRISIEKLEFNCRIARVILIAITNSLETTRDFSVPRICDFHRNQLYRGKVRCVDIPGRSNWSSSKVYYTSLITWIKFSC